MAKSDFQINLEIDQKTYEWFQRTAPNRLTEARKNAVNAAGIVWADTAKEITRSEDHVDTSLYVNSIGYVSGSPASSSDVIHELTESGTQTDLQIGSSVSYAAALEKRYAIMARAIDTGQDRMQRVATNQIKNTLRL